MDAKLSRPRQRYRVSSSIQGHQSNCNLSNKAWANESSLSPHSTVDKHTNQQNEKTSCDPTSSICQQINNSKTKLMPRARSSDTFEHPGKLQGHHPIQIDGSPALSFVGNMRGHSTTPAVHHGDPSGAFANVGYGALFAKLEMLNKSVEGNSEPDEHVSWNISTLEICVNNILYIAFKNIEFEVHVLHLNMYSSFWKTM